MVAPPLDPLALFLPHLSSIDARPVAVGRADERAAIVVLDLVRLRRRDVLSHVAHSQEPGVSDVPAEFKDLADESLGARVGEYASCHDVGCHFRRLPGGSRSARLRP